MASITFIEEQDMQSLRRDVEACLQEMCAEYPELAPRLWRITTAIDDAKKQWVYEIFIAASHCDYAETIADKVEEYLLSLHISEWAREGLLIVVT